jgi:hypothetical protein
LWNLKSSLVCVIWFFPQLARFYCGQAANWALGWQMWLWDTWIGGRNLLNRQCLSNLGGGGLDERLDPAAGMDVAAAGADCAVEGTAGNKNK